jgi:DNA-binding LacI/PurR family transcriptional regulator
MGWEIGETELVRTGDFSEESGERGMRELLARTAHRPP